MKSVVYCAAAVTLALSGAQAAQGALFVKTAQVVSSGFEEDELLSKVTLNENLYHAEQQDAFQQAKVTNVEDANKVEIHQLNTTVADTPHAETQVWVKMMSQAGLKKRVPSMRDAVESSTQGTCAGLNEELFNSALRQRSAADQNAYRASGFAVEFATDSAQQQGNDWLATPVTAVLTGKTLKLTSSKLLVAPSNGGPIPPVEFTGVLYCKLWSEQSSSDFISLAIAL